MKSMLIVGFGGCIGAIIRYKLSGLVMHHTEGWKFPAGTFAVNVIGCLVAGIMMALAIKHNYFSPNIRLLIFTGLLGGFTTFSAFGVDTVYLLERHEIFWAGLYVLLTVLAGITALWLGTLTIR
jgi:CrcB protein